jgi:hypothetical protein
MRTMSYSAMVDPGNDLCYLNCGGVDKTTTKRPSSGALVVEHSIPLSKQHPMVYKGAWELSA